jgi:heme exporter protein C
LKRKRPLPVWFLGVAALSMPGALCLSLLLLSAESITALTERIFWFQVPAALVCFLSVFGGGTASVLYLKTRDYRYDDFAAAVNESVWLFAGVNVLAGLVWTRRALGFWWNWDAGVTSSVSLILIYVAYGIIRSATPMDRRGTISAVVCVFGMLDVPFIYLSTHLFRARHAPPIGGGYSGLGAAGISALLVTSVAMLPLWWCIVTVRRSVERLDRRSEGLARSIYAMSVRGCG